MGVDRQTVTPGELPDLCEALRLDPLHNVSLGGKELFHSNLLAWFAERHTILAEEVFRDSARAGDPGVGETVERERAHLDLVFRFKGLAPIAIENKVWSLPDEHQLARYATGPLAKPRFRTASLVLLSLADPGWRTNTRTLGGRTWTHLAYSTLADRLEPATRYLVRAQDEEDRFAGELLTRYVRWVRRLDNVARSAGTVRDYERVSFDKPTRTR